jgi:VWFA-related protein
MRRYRNRLLCVVAILWLGLTMNCPSIFVLAQEYIIHVTQVQTHNYPEITLYVEVKEAGAERAVSGLQQADLFVTEDGQPVDIVDFAGIGDERPVDVVFVFDTTGSMQDEIEGVKDTCIAFAEELESKGRDYRLGLVTFWDEIKRVYKTGGTLTDDVHEFKRWIEGLQAQGGDDGPELALDALVRGSQMRFRDDAQRVLILITDASPHHRDDPTDFSDLTIDETLHVLETAQVTLFAVAPDLSILPEQDDAGHGLPGRYGLPANNEYGRMADDLGGEFYDISRESDFTGIIEQIGTTIATQYRITYNSPRPTYDGTRRDIQVHVGGGSTGSGTYLEQHLLNIQSDPQVGAVCLSPLLVMLIVPVGLRSIARGRSRSPYPAAASPPSHTLPIEMSPGRDLQAIPDGNRPPPTPPGTTVFVCPHCGRSLRPGARFCAGCGQPTGAFSPSRLAAPACPHCNSTTRPGARFCARCGHRLS